MTLGYDGTVTAGTLSLPTEIIVLKITIICHFLRDIQCPACLIFVDVNRNAGFWKGLTFVFIHRRVVAQSL